MKPDLYDEDRYLLADLVELYEMNSTMCWVPQNPVCWNELEVARMVEHSPEGGVRPTAYGVQYIKRWLGRGRSKVTEVASKRVNERTVCASGVSYEQALPVRIEE